MLKPLLQWQEILTPKPCRCENPATVGNFYLSILKQACEGYSLGLRRFDAIQGLIALQTAVGELWQQFQVPILC